MSQVSDGGNKNRRAKQKHQGDVTIILQVRMIPGGWIQNRLEFTFGYPTAPHWISYVFGLNIV
jgi:hypothetical protein